MNLKIMKKLLWKDTLIFLKMELRKLVVLGLILYDCNLSAVILQVTLRHNNLRQLSM